MLKLCRWMPVSSPYASSGALRSCDAASSRQRFGRPCFRLCRMQWTWISAPKTCLRHHPEGPGQLAKAGFSDAFSIQVLLSSFRKLREATRCRLLLQCLQCSLLSQCLHPAAKLNACIGADGHSTPPRLEKWPDALVCSQIQAASNVPRDGT